MKISLISEIRIPFVIPEEERSESRIVRLISVTKFTITSQRKSYLRNYKNRNKAGNTREKQSEVSNDKQLIFQAFVPKQSTNL